MYHDCRNRNRLANVVSEGVSGVAGKVQQPFNDFELMRAIAASDAQALSALYDRYSSLLLAVCRRVLKNTPEAEDVLTDVFFEVWTRADRFDASRGNPLTYLVTLTRSRAIDRTRSLASRPNVTSDNTDIGQTTTALDPLTSLDLDEQRKRVRDALSALDPAQREVLECSFYEGLSHSEIAEKLQKPLGTVKTYIRQGLIRLRDCLRIDQ